METIEVRTTQNVIIRTEVAGLGDRILAYLIDSLILFAYVLLVVLLTAGLKLPVLALILIPPILFYNLASEIFLEGQSLGKRIRNIKVVRLDGTPPRLADYLLRWLFRLVDIGLASGSVAVATILITGKGQRLGDVMAGTAVVKISPRVTLEDTVFTPIEETYAPVFPAADRLTAEEADMIREVLRAEKADPDSTKSKELLYRLTWILSTRLDIQTAMTPREFLKTLLKDYNALKGKL